MYGERDQPYAVVSRLGRRLEGAIALESVLPTIVETVAHSLKLPSVAIALGGPGAETIAASWGEPSSRSLRFPLLYRGEAVGTLLLAPRPGETALSDADRRVLDDLARQAGVAVHSVRLTTELQQARERLVAAREEERRRLRRDLHDGLGPQLGSQTLTLSAVRTLLRSDPGAAEALLDQAMTHAQQAIADIRRVVYDLRPPALDDLGLAGALRETAAQDSQNGLRITVDAPEPLPPLPAAVEVACYRIAQEALTNVVRHAHARNCAVRLSVDNGLMIEVRDDGVGLPTVSRPGVGTVSMRERATELGGSCEIDTVPGGGTRVLARLPLPSPVAGAR
jgi:signal transduction histidine kinase